MGASAAIALTIAAIVNDEPERIWMAALGAVIAVAIIGAIYQGSKMYYGSAMGFGWGDVVLSPLLGMYLGWLNPGIVAPGLFFGFIIGSVVGIAAMVLTKGDRQTAIPFGPSWHSARSSRCSSASRSSTWSSPHRDATEAEHGPRRTPSLKASASD